MPHSNNSSQSGTYSYTDPSGEVYGGSFATQEQAESSGYSTYEGENVYVSGGGGGTPVFRGTREQYQQQRASQRLEKEGIQIEGDLMRHDYKYSKYIKDGQFRVDYRHKPGTIDPIATKRLWIEYKKDLLSLQKDISDYKVEWGGYASKYDVKSWDLDVKAKFDARKQAGEDLLKGTYADTRSYITKKADTFKKNISAFDYSSLRSKWERQGLAEEHGQYSPEVVAHGVRGLGFSFVSSVGRFGAEVVDLGWRGTTFAFQHPKEALVATKVAGTTAKHFIGWSIKNPEATHKLTGVWLGGVVRGAKKDPGRFAGEWYGGGKFLKFGKKGIKGAVKGTKTAFNKRFYTEIRYTIIKDPYTRIRASRVKDIKISELKSRKTPPSFKSASDYKISDVIKPDKLTITQKGLQKSSSVYRETIRADYYKIRDFSTKFGGKKIETHLGTKFVTRKTTGRFTEGTQDVVGKIRTSFDRKGFGGSKFQRQAWEAQFRKKGGKLEGNIYRRYIGKGIGLKPGGQKYIKSKGKPTGKKITELPPKSAPLTGEVFKIKTKMWKADGVISRGKPIKSTSKALVDKKLLRRSKDLDKLDSGASSPSNIVLQKGISATSLTQNIVPKLKAPKTKRITTFKIKPSKPIKTRPIGRTETYQEYGLLQEGGLAPQVTGTGLTPTTGLSMKNLTKAGTIQRSKFKIASGVASRTGIGQDISQSLKSTTKSKQQQKQKTKQRLKLKTATIGRFKTGTFYAPKIKGLKMGKFKIGTPKKPQTYKLPEAEFNFFLPKLPSFGKERKATKKEKLGKRKTTRRARYIPSLTGVALRIKQPKGTKRGQYTGLEVRGI